MKSRLDFFKASPEAYKAMSQVSQFVHDCGLENSLLELVKLRASQINGCAFCIDMHTKDARAEGETEQRLYLLSAWREAPVYSERERAALEWTEALTLISENHVPDEVYERVKKQFDDKEMVNLTVAVSLINSWNRLAISFRTVTGNYKPGGSRAA
jgi:AhpD family alkylhydroperoxidase